MKIAQERNLSKPVTNANKSQIIEMNIKEQFTKTKEKWTVKTQRGKGKDKTEIQR